MSLYKKLLEIQQVVKGLSKDKKSHQYDYVTGNKLLGFIRPLMDEKGLLLKQEILSIENTRQDYKVWDKYAKPQPDWKPKNEILSKVMMKFTWIDVESGERDENLFGANGQNDWEKGLGSALTYAERYFLLKYFHIATDEDDVDNPERKPDPKEDPKEDPKKKPVSGLIELTEENYKVALKATPTQIKKLLKKYREEANHFMKIEYRTELEKLSK